MPLSEVSGWDLEDLENAVGYLDMRADNDSALNAYQQDKMDK